MNQVNTSWCVYILKCSDGSYYTGSTNNIDRRVAQHNNGTGAKYTHSHSPVELAYFEPQLDRSSAAKREIEIKKLTHLEKKYLVENFQPNAVLSPINY